ncbi:tRNA glutamyl-Q(34) synthetase GluQRS [Nannocystis sp. SCPEA4]|uniref:tRNA glutamyl-Q(34) synthetase GluQRS n=1 Tax=Nannocystis sp. SCPEA4 TaxID=2996787 RepID=UPI00226DAA2F|nr:tRNA glutamyl-Q(34) synthetase GluQRS [Nannocystis sp. SCPEA4]MCY1062244.1 tRNA glutamyl-Q(34) synthetase GluQRS [Nannocystis sp. SCPEA4]
MSGVRGRYAPSPTGPLHLGNARTALLAWLDVRARGGVFVMRIEDVDFTRARPEYEAQLLLDLRWLGLDWDEGPDVGGAFGPYRQSERGDRYAAALARLDVYPCTCTRRELRALPVTSMTGEPVYPGTCRNGQTNPGRSSAIRWRVPPGSVGFVDRLCGEHHQDIARDVGDFVLRRGDGAWAYQLAVVVDDADMAITDVVRGADLLDSTPRQLHLLRALYPEFPAPRFAHVPLILGAGGAKLSKRDGAPDLGALREAGASPARVVAALARSVGLAPPEVRELRPSELLTAVSPADPLAHLTSRPLDLDGL